MVSFECYSILQKEKYRFLPVFLDAAINKNIIQSIRTCDIMSAREQSGLVHFANGE